ncbi:MAG: glycosyltransferase, partial [Eggerthellaceae bacterium]|nr:glycosyltransferase [Eggerthellaceae bacterium]
DSRVIAIDQENANWGGVVNHGIALAKGTYFKIVDSDDFLDTEALKRVLDTLASLVEADNAPDLLVTNYVYDRVTDKSQHTIQYRKLLPSGHVFKWSEMGHPGIDQFIMVHASWYRTQVLRDSGVKLPTGVSYMDSLFVLHPMPWVEKLYYLDVDTYHYIIGREGQSVEVEVVKKCIDQQLMATRLAIQDANYTQLYAEEPNRALLMMGYISCMMSVSTIYLFKINTPESLQKNRELWAFMKETDSTLYNNVKRTWAGLANRRTRIGRFLAQAGYALAQKIFKFA